MTSDIFDQLPILQGLSQAQLDLLRPLFVICEYNEGTVIFEQGDPAEFLFLVVSGEAVIRYKPDDGALITVTRVRPGGVVGWSAVIGRRNYTSGAICTMKTQLLRVRGDDLQSLCQQHPETGLIILERLADIIAERLRHIHPEVVAILENGLRNGYNRPGG